MNTRASMLRDIARSASCPELSVADLRKMISYQREDLPVEFVCPCGRYEHCQVRMSGGVLEIVVKGKVDS